MYTHTMTNDTPPEKAIEQKLDEIIVHLKHLDRRDNVRMWWSSIRTVLAILPIILVIGGGWYLVEHWVDIISSIAKQMASTTTEYTKNQGQNVLDEIKNIFRSPTNE